MKTPILIGFLLVYLLQTAMAEIGFNEHIRPILSDKCYHCHGPDEENLKANLRLDQHDEATKSLKGGGVAIVPGYPEKSELIRRVSTLDEDDLMPPSEGLHGRLSTTEISHLKQWIKEGAIYQKHWSFEPIAKVTVPKVKGLTSEHNEIDAFIHHKLNEQQLKPLGLAPPHVQLRRLYLDLTGLLPPPEKVKAFEKNPSLKHYQNIVDELLTSSDYAERWARHWLDQARYADSNGYSHDKERNGMWIYRDWVIKALADDMPFDQFTIEQLAGDHLKQPSQPQIIATAFQRNTMINTEGGVKPEQFRNEAVVDRVNTVGQVWLGLTMECASCHNHKFDPITQEDYYKMFAYFNQATDSNNLGKTITSISSQHKKEVESLQTSLKETKKKYESLKSNVLKDYLSSPKISAEEKTLLQKNKHNRHETKQIDDLAHRLDKSCKSLSQKVKSQQRSTTNLINRYKLMVMEDVSKPRTTHLLERGDYRSPGRVVTPGTIAVLPPIQNPMQQPNRLELAKWLMQKDHPLTARVKVNRVWMRYFGLGLVETEEDFGSQGTPPTHPKLLDWLSNYFMDHDWSLKALHKKIVTSHTYRRSSQQLDEHLERDPKNQFKARQSRIRVDAELVRDMLLCASGRLSKKVGGPPVYPWQPDGIFAFGQVKKHWPLSKGDDAYRRTLYTFFYRGAPYPIFTTFDAPNFVKTCTHRTRTTTPLQSLTLANDPSIQSLAGDLALRVMKQSSSFEERLQHMYYLTLSRAPRSSEVELMKSYTAHWAIDSEAYWKAASRVLINTNEFIFRE